MSRKTAVLLVGLVCLAVAAGCGGGDAFKDAFKQGITGRVVDSYGKPIANARVSVVQVPPGGIQALTQMVRNGDSLMGWHFTTNDKGKFRLQRIPTGGLVESGYTPPQVYTARTDSTASGSAYGSGGYASGHASGSSTTTVTVPGQTQYSYEPGQWLGFVVVAAGYQPYVTLVNFPNPTGSMEKVTLMSIGPFGLKVDERGMKVTLAPLRQDGQAVATFAQAETDNAQMDQSRERSREPEVVQVQTIRVPREVISRIFDAKSPRPPGWNHWELESRESSNK